jgi:histidinol-phosphate aminotransferase
MTVINQLIRQDLLDIQAYHSSRESQTEKVWMDMNELPWDFSFRIAPQAINRYPERNPEQLMLQLAEFYQVKQQQLALTRGSDDGADALIRLCCTPFKDEVMIFPPTFSMYAISAKLQGAQVIEVPLLAEQQFALDIDSVMQRITPETKIIFVCTPNNPTGNSVAKEDIIAICNKVANQAIVVVDEAYIEFSPHASMATLVDDYPNLVVLRTLSKAFGLAGIRCGIVIAQPAFIQYLQAVIPPFPFAKFTLDAALCLTTQESIIELKKHINIILEQKAQLQQKLATFPFIEKIYASDANFLLIKSQSAKQIFQYCIENGICLRNFNEKSVLKDFLRITVGIQEQNDKLLSLFNRIGD